MSSWPSSRTRGRSSCGHDAPLIPCPRLARSGRLALAELAAGRTSEILVRDVSSRFHRWNQFDRKQAPGFAKLRENPNAIPDTTEDREALELATEQRPNDALAWLLLASRRVRDGDLGSAEDALKRVTLLAPNYAQAYYLSAYVKGRLKDYSAAQTAISQSLKLNPGYSEAWYYQGLLFDKNGSPSEAAKAYRNTVRLRPTHPNAWKNLAYSLKKSGHSTEAKEAFAEHAKRTAKR